MLNLVVVSSATRKVMLPHASSEQIAHDRQEDDEDGRYSADLGCSGGFPGFETSLHIHGPLLCLAYLAAGYFITVTFR
jgi:hypothetical protein